MPDTVKDTEKSVATLVATDDAGNPGTLDVVPAWTSSDTTIATIVPAEDGMSAEVSAVGPVGTADITVTAGLLSVTDQFNVAGGAATKLSITWGPAQPK